ncbi:MAG: hypothetical protein QME14_02730 [Methanobacteriaceae archaeon]|nr:hypothetical protein [Methanobacteriaceae archaeon]
MRIAIAAEIAPAKSLIPIIKCLDAEIIGLTHGSGVKNLLEPYCTKIHSIGHGRKKEYGNRSNFKIAYLVLRDIMKAVKSLKGQEIDLLLTCGNAGDVRKGIAAAKILKIPTLHIEQDIYNPIEMIAFSNLVTVPSQKYKNFLEERYGLSNVRVIGGYPMASYVNMKKLNYVSTIKNHDNYLLVVLGGDIKSEDLPKLIEMLEYLDKEILIAPFRFKSGYVSNFINSSKLKVLDGYVDLFPLMKASSGMIYGAGMGLTIEAGVLEIPSIKLAGFHHEHASVDLAKELKIPVLTIEEIPKAIENLKKPKGHDLIKNGEKSVYKLVKLINNFDSEKIKTGGVTSMRRIWEQRSKFR